MDALRAWYAAELAAMLAEPAFAGFVDHVLLPYLVLMVFATAWTAAGPALSRWRTAWRRNRAAATERPEPIGPGTRLVLVPIHGTFAFGAAWAQRGSTLVERARAAGGPGTVVRRFLWSGGNTYRARAVAAAELRDVLAALRAEAAAAGATPRIVLLAHSHGGNVAVDAVEGVGAGEAHRVDRIVTMATPFLRLKARPVSLAVEIAVVLVPAFAALFVAMRWLPVPDAGWIGTYLLVTIVLGCAFGLAVNLYGHRIRRQLLEGTRWRDGAGQRLEGMLLIVRTEADEASGALGLLAAAMGLVRLLVNVPLQVLDRFAAFATGERRAAQVLRIGLVLAIAGTLAAGVLRFVSSGWHRPNPLGSLFLLTSIWLLGVLIAALRPRQSFVREQIEGWLAMPASIVLAVVTLGFGNELIFAAPFVSIASEPSPAGRFVIHQFAASGGFAHSDAYQDPAVIELVAADVARLVSRDVTEM